MANARKCDRCERCFDPLKEEGYMCRFRNPWFQTRNDIREGIVKKKLLNNEAPDAIVDLCPECSEKFIKFMCGQDFLKEKANQYTEETQQAINKYMKDRGRSNLFGLKDSADDCMFSSGINIDHIIDASRRNAMLKGSDSKTRTLGEIVNGISGGDTDGDD